MAKRGEFSSARHKNVLLHRGRPILHTRRHSVDSSLSTMSFVLDIAQRRPDHASQARNLQNSVLKLLRELALIQPPLTPVLPFSSLMIISQIQQTRMILYLQCLFVDALPPTSMPFFPIPFSPFTFCLNVLWSSCALSLTRFFCSELEPNQLLSTAITNDGTVGERFAATGAASIFWPRNRRHEIIALVRVVWFLSKYCNVVRQDKMYLFKCGATLSWDDLM